MGTLGRVAARCDVHLSVRLLEWYDALEDCSLDALEAQPEWLVQVRPYDVAFVDPDEADDDAATVAGYRDDNSAAG